MLLTVHLLELGYFVPQPLGRSEDGSDLVPAPPARKGGQGLWSRGVGVPGSPNDHMEGIGGLALRVSRHSRIRPNRLGRQDLGWSFSHAPRTLHPAPHTLTARCLPSSPAPHALLGTSALSS